MKPIEVGTLEAKTHLSDILEQVQGGARFLITKRGKPVAQLGPVEKPKVRRRAGFGKGVFVYVAPDFNAPLREFAEDPVKLLLDTQALIWFAADDRRLSAAARNAVENSANEVFYSAASIWEMAIKASLGKLKLSMSLDDSFRTLLEKNGFDFLAVEFDHAAGVSTLPMHHGDRFDRLLIAQAIVEGMRPVSNDEGFDAYPVQRLW